MRWFERRWDESRGDEHDDWGSSTWLFEVGDDGWPIRQIEVYDQGPTNRYGPGQESDEFGCLSQAPLDEHEPWEPWAISSERFDEAWANGSDDMVEIESPGGATWWAPRPDNGTSGRA